MSRYREITWTLPQKLLEYRDPDNMGRLSDLSKVPQIMFFNLPCRFVTEGHRITNNTG